MDNNTLLYFGFVMIIVTYKCLPFRFIAVFIWWFGLMFALMAEILYDIKYTVK